MKTLFLDLSMGAAGDMLTAALLELLPDPESFVERLNSLGIPGVRFQTEKVNKLGITGTHVTVTVHGTEEGEEHDHHHDHEHHHHDHGHGHDHHHHHSTLEDIRHIVTEHIAIPKKVAGDVMAVYELIAEAESRVHGKPVGEVHFHEVGAMDAVADITAVCLLLNELSPDKIVASPVCTGFGEVKCAHGILPVPAPATALILTGMPIYAGDIRGELCTPTGAALVKHFAASFGELPPMTVKSIGYGMGKKDFPRANCIRSILGESADETDTVLELSCNVDDMTAEEIAFAVERLFEGGAFEVYTVPIGMKKSRPGVLIRVMCSPEKEESLVRLIFKHTSTIGVRETKTKRFVLKRRIEPVETGFGAVRVKRSSGYGAERKKYEFDDLALIARGNGLSIREVREMLDK